MKKLIGITMALAMVLMTACSGTPVISPSSSVPAASSEESASSSEAVSLPSDGSALKTGLAVVPSVASSKDAGEEPGLAQSDVTLVAVTVDENGVITNCAIDSVQAKINFDASGKITTDLAAPIPTKNELGDAYGMKKASGIGKEWNEQAAAFAQYVVGKTADEVKGIALNEKGAAADADLASSVTVSIGGYMDAVVQAVENAQPLGAAQGDTLVLSAVTSAADSKDAGEEPGLAQAYVTVAATTYRDDVISSCVIDAVQCNVNFDAAGKITTDLAAPILTKNQLGDDYGMKKASAIGKEWYEQAAAFAQYVVGKTADEVAGIAVTEKGAAADADLASSVTIGLGAFQQVIVNGAA